MPYRWRLVAVLFVVAGLNYADRTAISAILVPIRSEFHLSDIQLALIGSVFLWTYAGCAPLAGYLSDRVSRARLIAFSLGLWSLATAAAGLTSSFGELLATRVVLGIAESVYFPSAIALIASAHDRSTRATANGLHLAGLNLGLVAGGTICGYLAEHYGWRVPMFVLGGAGLLAAVAVMRLLHDDSPAPRAEAVSGVKATVTALAGARGYRYVVATSMLVASGVWVFFHWLPLYLEQSFGFSLAAAGFVGTFLLQAPAVLGVSAGGVLSDRATRTNPLGRMRFQSMCYLAAAPSLVAFVQFDQFAPVAVALFVFALLRGMGGANEDMLTCEFVPPLFRSTALGVLNMANCAAGGAGILIAGAARDRIGFEQVFAAVGLVVATGGLIAWFGFRRLSTSNSPDATAVAEVENGTESAANW